MTIVKNIVLGYAGSRSKPFVLSFTPILIYLQCALPLLRAAFGWKRHRKPFLSYWLLQNLFFL